MEKRNLNFEISTSVDLNKVLTGAIMDLRRGDLNFDVARAITNLADKINKNNIAAIEYKRLTKHNRELSFFNGEEIIITH